MATTAAVTEEDLKRTKETWDTIDIDKMRQVAWMSVPYFQDVIWRRFSDGEGPVKKTLKVLKERMARLGRERLRGIALACGDMAGERCFFEDEMLPFERADGYDLSDVVLARYAPKPGLHFVPHVEDVNRLELEPESAGPDRRLAGSPPHPRPGEPVRAGETSVETGRRAGDVRVDRPRAPTDSPDESNRLQAAALPAVPAQEHAPPTWATSKDGNMTPPPAVCVRAVRSVQLHAIGARVPSPLSFTARGPSRGPDLPDVRRHRTEPRSQLQVESGSILRGPKSGGMADAGRRHPPALHGRHRRTTPEPLIN